MSVDMIGSYNTYGEAWNATDASEAASLLAKSWAEGGVLFDPDNPEGVKGRAALVDYIMRSKIEMEGLDISDTYSVVNDPRLTALVREAAGAEWVVEIDPLMAFDDFSVYLRAAPGCFFFIGAGNARAFPHHHPRFTIDERALPVGIETLTRAALRFLADDYEV